jgi:hypothetical protein
MKLSNEISLQKYLVKAIPATCNLYWLKTTLTNEKQYTAIYMYNISNREDIWQIQISKFKNRKD